MKEKSTKKQPNSDGSTCPWPEQGNGRPWKVDTVGGETAPRAES